MDAKKPLIIIPPPPQHFTMKEWTLNNEQKFRVVKDQHQLAEKIVEECKRVIAMSDEATVNNKMEVDVRLQERVGDIEFKKKENEILRIDICKEIEALETYKDRISDALESIRSQGCKICKKCLILRECRLGIDLVHDDVEMELKKEVHIIEAAQSLFMRTLEQTNEQIRLIRATLYFLDRDNRDKTEAIKIDTHCKVLNERSLNLSIYHGKSALNCGTVPENEWETFSKNNIESAAKELCSARPLRNYVDILLNQIVEDLQKQSHKTNETFLGRITETKKAKEKLEDEHRETVSKISDVNKTIDDVKKAISSKEKYLALAHTRLGNRAQRPGIELTNDDVEKKLVSEVIQLQENLSSLNKMLNEAKASLRYLLKTQIQLEEDINIKTNTLKIDEVDCMGLRAGLNFHAY